MKAPRRLLCGAGLLVLAACGGEATAPNADPPPPPRPTPRFGHVFLVVEENTDYSTVIGNGGAGGAPYFDSLASEYGLATQYYADTHPSIGNYFMLTVGKVLTNNDAFSGLVTEDNIARELVASGKTWKSYAEGLPSVGYLGNGPGRYARKHNPFSYLSDVVSDSTQRRSLAPFSQFATDLANNTLTDFALIVPDLCHDAHDCSLHVADAWLRSNMAPLIASPIFQRDGLLIIVFDESSGDRTEGGGRVPWVEVSPKSKRGYRSAVLYRHENTLRLIAEGLGLSRFPGAAAAAENMAEFFVTP